LASARIQVCGRVVVEVDGRRIDDALPGRQGRLLFVYLVVNRLRPAPRDELVDAVWADDPPANVESALSSLLSKLRRVVELEGRSEVRLLLPADAWVDLEAATDGLHRAESAAAREAWTEVWGPARVAQHVTKRQFLAGEDASWVRELRNRLEGVHLRSLELVARACLHIAGSELDTAERAARELVARAPYRESGYRFLMELLDRRDNRAEALRVYEQLRTLLREDLGTSPSPATQDVYRRVLG
jgi:DNA-binding SARP family transcriptional activator